MNQSINMINHVYVFFIDDFEEHQEDMYPMFDDDDAYDDDYFHELYEKDDWVLALSFEGICCLYVIIQILFIRKQKEKRKCFYFIVLLRFY